MSISEKLITIANNEQKVYHSGQLNIISNSKHLQGSASGAIVSVNDVTPIEHNVWFEDTSRNLFDISKIINTSNITNNQDGSLTIKANAIYSQLDSLNTLKSLCPLLKVGDVATFSMKTLSTYYKGIYLPTSKRMWQSGTALTITENDLQSRPVFYGFESSEENYGTENIISNIQVELGNATEYVPHKVNVEGVKVASKNLFDFPQKSATRNQWDNSANWGLNYIDVSHLRGKTITYQATYDLTNIDVNNASNYTDLYGCVILRFYNPDRSVISVYGGNDVIGQGKVGISKITKQVPDVEGVLAGFDFRTSFYGHTTTEAIGEDYIKVSNPMVEFGDTATSYTPYVADLTGVEVRKCGANLFPFSEGITLKGRYLNAWSDDFLPRQNNVEFLRGKRITFSTYFDLSGAVEDTTSASVKVMYYDDSGALIRQMFGNQIKKADGITQGYAWVCSDVPVNTSVIGFALSIFFNSTATPDPNSFVTVSQGMVTLGNELKEHEPYTETTYTANADGTVEGVKSISPNMTLIPNNNAVTVSANYYKDVSKVVSDLTTAIALSGGE